MTAISDRYLMREKERERAQIVQKETNRGRMTKSEKKGKMKREEVLPLHVDFCIIYEKTMFKEILTHFKWVNKWRIQIVIARIIHHPYRII